MYEGSGYANHRAKAQKILMIVKSLSQNIELPNVSDMTPRNGVINPMSRPESVIACPHRMLPVNESGAISCVRLLEVISVIIDPVLSF